MKETSRAKSVWPEENNKIAIVLSSSHQVQDPGAHSQQEEKSVTSKESFDKVKIRLSEIK